MSEWNKRCEASIKKEKAEAEARYGIKFGQTEIYCANCGRPCTPGSHTCGNVRVKRWREAKKKVKQTPKSVTPLSQAEFVS
jgi:hypothetical protein